MRDQGRGLRHEVWTGLPLAPRPWFLAPRPWSLAPFVLLLATLLLITGCVNFSHVLGLGEGLPKAPVQQIATTWTNQVIFTPDPVHGGKPTPGMAGRLYLFDARGLPVVGDGSLTIELYDDSARAKGTEAKLLELWKFNKEALHQLLSRDTIGWGYTLFLPWGTYSPGIKAVYMKVCYASPKSMPLYDQSGPIVLNGEGNVKVRTEQRSIPPTAEKKEAVTQQ
jgi:hypothetical protein